MLPLLSPSGVPIRDTDILAGYFRDAQARMKRIVLEPPGRTARAREFNAARAADQLRQIEQTLMSLRQQSASWVGEFLPIAMADGQRRADQQALEAGIRPDRSPIMGHFGLINPHVAMAFARDTYSDLAKAADSMAARSSRVLRATRQQGLDENQINTILAGGTIDGKPVQAIRQLREELRRVHGDQVQVIDRNGRPINFEVGYYAKMVAVTKTRQATTVARHERLEQLDLDLVSIVGRVSVNFCSAYLGQVFSISGKSTEYPPLSSLPSGGPPFHPNCTKSTRPFIVALASPKQLEHADGLDDEHLMRNIDATQAQRRYKDLQILTQVRAGYQVSAASLFGKVA